MLDTYTVFSFQWSVLNGCHEKSLGSLFISMSRRSVADKTSIVEAIVINGCPEDLDERSELYCLHRLSHTEVSELESHLAVCPACLLDVTDARAFLSCLRMALREDTSSPQADTVTALLAAAEVVSNRRGDQ